MPREIITNPTAVHDIDEHGYTNPLGREPHATVNAPILAVGWARQTEMIGHGYEPESTVSLELEVDIRQLRAIVADADQSDKDEPDSPIEAAFVGTLPLTRGQINNLIRTLKRARDASLGSDE